MTRPGVDPERIGLLGISYGGYFVLRAAVADSRVRAVVANSPIVDLRWYVTSFVGFDPEQALTADDDRTRRHRPDLRQRDSADLQGHGSAW